MALVIIDPLDSAASLVRKLADAGQPLLSVWTEPYRRHPTREELADIQLRVEHIDLKTVGESAVLQRIAASAHNVVLGGSYPGILLAERWNARLSSSADSGSALAPQRWVDKLCFDEVLQRMAPPLALSVFAADGARSLSERHLLRQRVSQGAGSARWPGAGGEMAFAAGNIEYCAHLYQEGRSFFCNGVRFQDGLAATDAWWCYDKSFGSRHLLCGVTPFLPQDERYASMLSAVELAAHALSLPLGPFHVEGVLCSDGGVRLLKVLPKLAGFPLPTLCERMGCLSQLALTVQAWPSNFARKPDLPQPARYAADFSFPTACAGRIEALEGMEAIEQLASFDSYAVRCKPGEHVAASYDELSYPITIWLEHADPRQLEADVAVCMRRLEQGLYRLA